jgi:hypothetical protein
MFLFMFFCRHINTANRICARLKVLTAVFLNFQVLWDLLLCSCVNISWCIEGSQRLCRWVYVALSSHAPSLLGLLVLDNRDAAILRNVGHYQRHRAIYQEIWIFSVICISRHSGWNRRKSCKRVKHFRYFLKPLTNQNSIRREIKNRLKSGNAWNYSVQNSVPSSLLSKNIKIKMHRPIILTVLCMGVKPGSSQCGGTYAEDVRK